MQPWAIMILCQKPSTLLIVFARVRMSFRGITNSFPVSGCLRVGSTLRQQATRQHTTAHTHTQLLKASKL